MKTFFIEEGKVSYIKRFFKKIQRKENKIIINTNLKKMKVENKLKLAKKINNILVNERCRQIVIQKRLKKDIEFINLLNSLGIKICSSKWLFKKCTEIIIDKINLEEKSEISICINYIDDLSEKLIDSFARKFKRINIVTNYIGKYKNIEKRLYEDDGIIVNITNNKKKSLAKSSLILNIDFPKEIINKFTIFGEANIISWEDGIKINKKRFNGKIIDNVKFIFEEDDEIKQFLKTNELEDFEEADICEMMSFVPDLQIEILH